MNDHNSPSKRLEDIEMQDYSRLGHDELAWRLTQMNEEYQNELNESQRLPRPKNPVKRNKKRSRVNPPQTHLKKVYGNIDKFLFNDAEQWDDNSKSQHYDTVKQRVDENSTTIQPKQEK